MKRPAGRISAICGVRREILSISVSPNSMPASPASAGTCRHAFVEPPSAAATVIAFSNDAFVRIMDGRRSFSSASTRVAAARRTIASRAGSAAAGDAIPGTVSPSASEMLAIVFAVYMLAHEPLPGSATHSSSVRSARLILPVAWAPMPSYTSWIDTSLPRKQPGLIEPPYANTDGRSSRIIASIIAGRVLSQPAIVKRPSIRSAWTTSSTESAIQSREGSDERIPSVPIAMPSETEIVWKTNGRIRSDFSSSAAASASSSRCMLHGVTAFHDAATPACGSFRSSVVQPIARSIERAAAWAGPPVTSRLRFLPRSVPLMCPPR